MKIFLKTGTGLLLLCTSISAGAQELIRLWPGMAPGSEHWAVPESVSVAQSGDRIFANVSEPAIEVFLPPAGTGNGTAVVIAPGGALRVLGYDSGGTHIAQWLNSIGVAGIVLKYRTLQQASDDNAIRVGGTGNTAPRVELQVSDMPLANANPERDNAALQEVIRMGLADLQQALKLVRSNAGKWNIEAGRVGAMGFSAGGGIAIAAALADPATTDTPDFLISLYGPSLVDVHVPESAPPLFMAAGAEHFNVTNGLLALFIQWKKAGKPVELHIYEGVSSGFDLTERGQSADDWNEQLHKWLTVNGLVEP